MRGLIAAAVLFFSMVGVAHAQEVVTGPASEMKAVEFLLGNYKGDVNFYFMGKKSGRTCAAKADRALNDCFILSMITYNMAEPGQPAMDMSGMHMITYDRVKKQYVSWWFDSTATNDMHLTGNFEGDKLVMISEPTEIPGMGKIVMRSCWWKDKDGVAFSLEMKDGEKWQPMMEGVFKKS